MIRKLCNTTRQMKNSDHNRDVCSTSTIEMFAKVVIAFVKVFPKVRRLQDLRLSERCLVMIHPFWSKLFYNTFFSSTISPNLVYYMFAIISRKNFTHKSTINLLELCDFFQRFSDFVALSSTIK